jgi:hypothetical protein
LTSTKIAAGIPHPLRGLVWQSIASARDTHLEGLYAQLSRETTPYEKVIERDLARTFPEVDMFRHEDGDGQLDLGNVLRAFSLYDSEVGYCQGLGFIVAPLLMNMSHSEAFCVLVRLMEAYEMRLMYTPTLAGLKLRLYQFEKLVEQSAPVLARHLKTLEIYPAMYASQWFLSLYAVTCPLQTLHRIYDIFLAEGPETMMRIGLALLMKNQEKILQLEMEDVLAKLLGSSLWEAYEDDDTLIEDIQALIPLVTADSITDLEQAYHEEQQRPMSQESRGLQAIASSFLGRMNPGRLFSGSHTVQRDTTNGEMDVVSISSRTSSATATEQAGSSGVSRSSIEGLKKYSATMERQNKQLNEQIESLIEALTESHREVAQLKDAQDKHLGQLDELKAASDRLLEGLYAFGEAQTPDEQEKKQAAISRYTSELQRTIKADPCRDAFTLQEQKIAFLESELDERNHELGRIRGSLASTKSALDQALQDRAKSEKALTEARRARAGSPESGMRELRLKPQSRDSVQSIKLDNKRPSTLRSASNVSVPEMDELEALRLELGQVKAQLAISHQDAEEARYALQTVLKQQQHLLQMSPSSQRETESPSTPGEQDKLSTPPVTATGSWFRKWGA